MTPPATNERHHAGCARGRGRAAAAATAALGRAAVSSVRPSTAAGARAPAVSVRAVENLIMA